MLTESLPPITSDACQPGEIYYIVESLPYGYRLGSCDGKPLTSSAFTQQLDQAYPEWSLPPDTLRAPAVEEMPDGTIKVFSNGPVVVWVQLASGEELRVDLSPDAFLSKLNPNSQPEIPVAPVAVDPTLNSPKKLKNKINLKYPLIAVSFISGLLGLKFINKKFKLFAGWANPGADPKSHGNQSLQTQFDFDSLGVSENKGQTFESMNEKLMEIFKEQGHAFTESIGAQVAIDSNQIVFERLNPVQKDEYVRSVLDLARSQATRTRDDFVGSNFERTYKNHKAIVSGISLNQAGDKLFEYSNPGVPATRMDVDVPSRTALKLKKKREERHRRGY